MNNKILYISEVLVWFHLTLIVWFIVVVLICAEAEWSGLLGVVDKTAGLLELTVDDATFVTPVVMVTTGVGVVLVTVEG